MKRLYAVLGAIALGTIAAPKAQAAPVSFSVTPMINELSAKPGQTLTGVINVAQELAPGQKAADYAPMRLRVYAMDWTLDRKGAPQFLKAGTSSGSCSKWIQINPVELVVKPGETQAVRYTVTVPAEAQGTTHSMLMFETTATPAQVNGRAVAMNGRIGAAVYVEAGPQARRARLTKLSANADKTLVNIENTGSAHVRLKGTIDFNDASGKRVAQLALPGAVILPGDANVREFTLDTPKLPSGTYTATLLVDYGGDVLLGGRSNVVVP